MIITVKKIMSWGPCQPDYPEEKIRGIIGDGKTLLEICDLNIPIEDKIWILFHGELAVAGMMEMPAIPDSEDERVSMLDIIRQNILKSMLEKVQEAFSIVEERGRWYYPREDACYVCYEDKAGDILTFPGMEHFSYCENCIQEAILDVKREIKNKEIKKPRLYEKLDYCIESCPQSTDFLICDECGEIILSSKIWDFQELDHWNNIKDEESWEKLSLYYEFYQLKEILDTENGSFPEYPDETFMVAEKVIKYLGEK